MMTPWRFAAALIALLIASQAVAGVSQTQPTAHKLLCSRPASQLAKNLDVSLENLCKKPGPEGLFAPEYSLAGGVFLSCLSDTPVSCRDITEKIMANNPEVVLNLLFGADYAASDPARKLMTDLKTQALLLGTSINFFNFETDKATPKYLRDLGLHLVIKNRPLHLSFPYYEDDRLIEAEMNNILKQCDIDAQATEEIARSLDKKAPRALSVSDLESFDKNTINSMMGGNFLILPDNKIALGIEADRPRFSGPMRALQKRFDIIEIPLPKLEVGHIDEVFKLIKRSAHEYLILAASPLEMRKFLQSGAPADWLVSEVAHNDDFENLDARFLENTVQLNQLRDLALSSGELWATVDRHQDNIHRLLQVNARLRGIHNLSAREILADRSLQAYWDASQATIDRSTDQLMQTLRALRPKARVNVLKLPVYWNIKGMAILPNPVNSLYLNGHLYYSKPMGKTLSNQIVLEDLPEGTFSLRPELRAYPELDKHIKAILARGQFQKLIGVNTHEYDIGYGNIHCATYTIPASCH